jgi:hypothetical protein
MMDAATEEGGTALVSCMDGFKEDLFLILEYKRQQHKCCCNGLLRKPEALDSVCFYGKTGRRTREPRTVTANIL